MWARGRGDDFKVWRAGKRCLAMAGRKRRRYRISSFTHRRITMKPVLLVAGIHNSGATHWQSLWAEKHPGVSRVAQRDWDHPDCDEWAGALDQAVRRASEPPIIVAHSLGCLVLARWAAHRGQGCHAALLVAVPDPQGPAFPAAAAGFASAFEPLKAPRLAMVSSTDDPYSTPAYTRERVQAWGAEHIELGRQGHINAASGLGDWPQGWALVQRWR
jgi:predicted alpha/beta hydrolase family esterase